MATMLPDLSRYHAHVNSSPLHHAYKSRSPIIPWLNFKPVPEEEVAQVWETLRQTPRQGKTVAYIHIPFCSNHCLFCNFYRNSTRNDFSSSYVDFILRDIENESESRMVHDAPVHAVYVGGGTPTDLEARDLRRLLEALRKHLPLATDCEITVEGRPSGCTREKITACLDAGANRFSFGVQTFDTGVRRRLGRKMDDVELINFLGEICALDRATVVCDLIFGLPNQTEESWRRDLEVVTGLGLDGVDIYALTLLSSSPLAHALKKGSLPAGASVSEQASLYAIGVETLEHKGWRQLTSAHFSRETRERNLYNQLIKSGASCLAFGAGAGGAFSGFSYLITPDLMRYRGDVAEGKKALGGLYEAGEGHVAKAVVTGGIETGRLDLSSVEQAGVVGFAPAVLPLVQQWQTAGLVVCDGTILRPTLPGRFWHTNLTSALHHIIDTFNASPPSTGPSFPSKQKPMQTADSTDKEKQLLLETLRAKFAKSPDGILEMIAAQSGLTTREVTECLPDSCRTFVSGENFEKIMTDLSKWGEILLIVHTMDGVFECAGVMPKGEFGRGFYNLERGSPIRGHIRAENCADIALVRRPFMGKETCSLQFFNTHGDAMFKVFVSRDEDGSLKENQVKCFEGLRSHFAETATK